MSDVLERVRMCVAEAGYDPSGVTLSSNEGGRATIVAPNEIPTEVFWRARELATLGPPRCLECCIASMFLKGEAFAASITACLADRRLVLDCGRDR